MRVENLKTYLKLIPDDFDIKVNVRPAGEPESLAFAVNHKQRILYLVLPEENVLHEGQVAP